MRTIKLNISGLGRYCDVSPFIMADNSLKLSIDLPNYNGEFFLVMENNGVTAKYALCHGESVELNNLMAGELKAEVKHYLKGVLVKSYKIEPLIIIEADGTITATPEIVALNDRCAALGKELAETKEALQGTIKELTETKETLAIAYNSLMEQGDKIEKLVKFAFADYTNNVYLGGGSAAEFESEYGLNPENNEGDNGDDEV